MNRYLSTILLGGALMLFGLSVVLLSALSALVLWNGPAELPKVGSPRIDNGLNLTHVNAAMPTTDAVEALQFVGTVSLVSGDQLTITTQHESEIFFVPHDATILVNGVPATLADVRPGYWATVSAENENGRKVAEWIRAVIEY